MNPEDEIPPPEEAEIPLQEKAAERPWLNRGRHSAWIAQADHVARVAELTQQRDVAQADAERAWGCAQTLAVEVDRLAHCSRELLDKERERHAETRHHLKTARDVLSATANSAVKRDKEFDALQVELEDARTQLAEAREERDRLKRQYAERAERCVELGAELDQERVRHRDEVDKQQAEPEVGQARTEATCWRVRFLDHLETLAVAVDRRRLTGWRDEPTYDEAAERGNLLIQDVAYLRNQLDEAHRERALLLRLQSPIPDEVLAAELKRRAELSLEDRPERAAELMQLSHRLADAMPF